MDVAEWLTRLENTFGENGIIGRRLLPVMQQERQYGEKIDATFTGHSVLAQCFFDFYIETLEVAAEWRAANEIPRGFSEYSYAYLIYLTNFRSLRAVDILFVRGYPLDGYALLRDVKDRAIFLAAAISGESSFSALRGTKRMTEAGCAIRKEDFEAIRRAREAEERRVLKAMIRENSGLDESVREHLRRWERMFHREVHGSQLTMSQELPWLRGTEPLSIGPVFREKPAGLYMSTSEQVQWMLLRTLPFLQLERRAFGETWAAKWAVLDDSFHVSLESPTESGRPHPVASAIKAMLDEKFPFSPDTTYVERS